MREDSRAMYVAREAKHTRSRDDEQRRSARLARLRLGTFLLAVAALIWWLGFGGGVLAFALAAVLFAVFAVFVVIHARVEDGVRKFEALRVVNARGVARMDRAWDRLPDAPAPRGIDLDHHPYAIDLDLFGRASLYQWIGPAATSFGTRTLAGWLLNPADPEEVVHRQDALRELAELEDWREQLAAHGVVSTNAAEESVDLFLRWAGSGTPPLPSLGVFRVAVYGLLALLWVPLVLDVTGVLPNGVWPAPLLAGITLSFFTAGAVSRAFDDAGGGERSIPQYAGLFTHIDGLDFSAPRLTALKSRLEIRADGAHARHAPAAMRALNRILSFADLRRGAALLHFPIQSLTLWDFHCLFALESWRRQVQPHVRDWFEATGEIDALACLAAIHHDNPHWSFPAITSDATYRARALGHPLIPDARRVPNDVELGPPGTVLLVTGSNMSGKSTLLRAIGVNAVLAEAGAPVCAASLQMPSCDIQTSIRIQDSLEHGVSYFMAALARLKGVIDAAERDRDAPEQRRVLFYLLDEILQGTNSAERAIAVQAVAQHLLDAGAIGAMSTHDLTLAGEEPLKSHARLVHFTEIVDDRGEMSFDYKLREGLATSRNALRLMRLIGIGAPQP